MNTPTHTNSGADTKSKAIANNLGPQKNADSAVVQQARATPGTTSAAELKQMAGNSPGVKQLKALQVMANRNRNAGMQTGAPVMQMVWVQSGEGSLRWSGVLNGLQWFFDEAADRFYYHIIDDAAVPMPLWNMIERLEGELLSEGQLDGLGFQEIDEDASVVPQLYDNVGADSMVSQTVAGYIINNIRAGEPPFRPDLGLGGCSWFIWRGYGVPYTSIDKVKKNEEPKNVALTAVVSLPQFPLHISTQWLADRHHLIMTDPDFLARTEASFRAHHNITGATLNSRQKSGLTFYRKGLAERQMWVSIGEMVNQHPTGAGVVSLDASDFSKEGNGKFLIIANGSLIRIAGGEEEVRVARERGAKGAAASSAAASADHE